jgi:hypothetical protein
MISKRRTISPLLAAGLVLAALVLPTTTWGQAPQTVSVQMSQESSSLLVGESVAFSTVLRNTGADATPPLVAHLNVASLRSGVYVDPEDWSSARTRYLDPLQPGDAVTVDWKVRALTEGDFAVYVTLVAGDPTFVPVTGAPLLVHTSPSTILPMRTVLPVVVAVPFVPFVLVLAGIVQDLRRRVARNQTKPGESK